MCAPYNDEKVYKGYTENAQNAVGAVAAAVAGVFCLHSSCFYNYLDLWIHKVLKSGNL